MTARIIVTTGIILLEIEEKRGKAEWMVAYFGSGAAVTYSVLVLPESGEGEGTSPNFMYSSLDVSVLLKMERNHLPYCFHEREFSGPNM